jgi:hypothetical protein
MTPHGRPPTEGISVCAGQLALAGDLGTELSGRQQDLRRPDEPWLGGFARVSWAPS